MIFVKLCKAALFVTLVLLHYTFRGAGFGLSGSQSFGLPPSCGDLSGIYFDGMCFWLTSTYQNFPEGVDNCKHVSGQPVDDLSYSNWSFIAYRLSQRMNFFIGYSSQNNVIYRWDGYADTIRNMYLMWLDMIALTNAESGCAGYGSNGFTLYRCTEEKQMLCVSNTIRVAERGDLHEMISEMKNELIIDKHTLSSDVRRKTSATDSRQSSAAIGYLGIIVISVVCGIILLFDIMTFISCFGVHRKGK